MEKKLPVFVKPTVLMIDEMGYLKLDPNSAHCLFLVITQRYEHIPTKALGNGKKLWETRAMLDRLLRHSIT
ncbi:ATP-binding protein [Geobacillus sp.]|uniref:ATP-binding protein n=1 Tax=Geobacillus TaxID=129337 RepID=UPI0007C79F8A